ncbi:baculoviral IAP repeat-containing protein 2-like [Ruditapes philippinarum]|uniref:baculoviral IAP repeat-containing protein 2-like n=1 Tax=Ruditapes philippinarum TaxID=129788 RepID=UPI00295A9E74|nr:baculoviral IAP repeat-containing protein 2-like [Ruditapes philippinarum]
MTSNQQTSSNHSTLVAQQTTPEHQTQSENELSHEEQTTPNGETLPEQQTSSEKHATSEEQATFEQHATFEQQSSVQQTLSEQHITSEQQTSCVQQTSSEQQTTTLSSNTTYSFEPMMTVINKIADGQRVPPRTTMKYEMLRFSTLRSFPKENKPYITRLAGAGFYYANEGDEVICYCCARRRRNWTEFENPLEVHRELNPNCSFLIRNSEVNVSVRQSIESSTGESHSNLSTINRSQSNANFRNELTEVNVSSAVETGSQIQTNQNSEHSSFASNVISLRGGNQSVSLLPVDVQQTTTENQSSNNSTACKDKSVSKKQTGSESISTQGTEGIDRGSGNASADIDRLMHTNAAQSVLEMGYHPDVIRRAIRMVLSSTGHGILTATNLLEKIFEIEDSQSQENSAPENATTQETKSLGNRHEDATPSQNASGENGAVARGNEKLLNNGSSENQPETATRHNDDDRTFAAKNVNGNKSQARQQDVSSMSSGGSKRANLKQTTRERPASLDAHIREQKRLKEENDMLKQQCLCTQCHVNDVCIVFLPCGHLVTCETCAPTVRYCTVATCGKYIRGTVRRSLA